ncbi:MAG: hypothetical protein WCG47_02100 [Dermatophilaceae bacterium]
MLKQAQVHDGSPPIPALDGKSRTPGGHLGRETQGGMPRTRHTPLRA